MAIFADDDEDDEVMAAWLPIIGEADFDLGGELVGNGGGTIAMTATTAVSDL